MEVAPHLPIISCMGSSDLYSCVVGSRAFGLDMECSDTDVFRIDNGETPPPLVHGHYYIRSPQQAVNQFLADVPSASLRLLAAMFPASCSGGALAEYLQREREQIAYHTRSRYYTASIQRAEIFWGHNAEQDYRDGKSLKFPMYSIFFYHILADYATGRSMEECLRPSGELREWLLAVRRGEVPFAEVLQQKLVLHQKASNAKAFWLQPGSAEYISRVRRELCDLLFIPFGRQQIVREA